MNILRSPLLAAIGLCLVASLATVNVCNAQAGPTAQAGKEFKRLVALKAALARLPADRYDKEPHKTFLKKNENEIVYSDPSAEYYVRSELFWDLREKYKTLPIAEEIAWTAAENPIPGECEGYLNCYLYVLNTAWGKYLSYYPKGKYSDRALSVLNRNLAPMVADRLKKEAYEWPADASDSADLRKMLAELDATIAKTSGPLGSKARARIMLLRDAFK